MSSDSYNILEMDVIRWAEKQKIIPDQKPHKQLLNSVCELGKLIDSEFDGSVSDIKSGVGSVLASLIIYCALRDLSIRDCLDIAYHKLKRH